MRNKIAAAFILSFCLLFCSCGTNKTDLTVQCVCGKDYFTLPLDMEGLFEMPGSVSFSPDMDLTELKDTIDSQDFGTASIQTAIYGNILSIEKTDAQTKLHVYFVYRPSGRDRMYLSDGRWLDVVIPFHLLEESEEWQYSLLNLETETPYSTQYALEDFVAFYEKLEEYDLQTSENTVSVQLKEEYRTDDRASYLVHLTFEDNAVWFSYERT